MDTSRSPRTTPVVRASASKSRQACRAFEFSRAVPARRCRAPDTSICVGTGRSALNMNCRLPTRPIEGCCVTSTSGSAVNLRVVGAELLRTSAVHVQSGSSTAHLRGLSEFHDSPQRMVSPSVGGTNHRKRNRSITTGVFMPDRTKQRSQKSVNAAPAPTSSRSTGGLSSSRCCDGPANP